MLKPLHNPKDPNTSGFVLFFDYFVHPFGKNTIPKKCSQNEKLTIRYDSQCPKRVSVANHLQSSRTTKSFVLLSPSVLQDSQGFRFIKI